MPNSDNNKPNGVTNNASGVRSNNNGDSVQAARVRQLEDELRALRAEFQSSISYLESSNQELKKQLIKCTQAEQALVKTEQRIRSIVNTATDAIISINSTGVIEHFNLAAEKMFGYSAAEAIGSDVNILMPSPYREKHQQYLSQCHESKHSSVIGFTREIVARRKSGQIFPIELSVSQIDHYKCYTGIIRDLSWNKKLELELLTIADKTQRQIGQNLHDDISQEMTGLALKTEALQDLVSHKDKAGQKLISDIISGLDRTQNKISVLSRGLIPVAVDARGLIVALEELASEISTVYAISCTFSSTENACINNSTIATQLYHIAQEAINNAIRHGQARHIQIKLNKNGRHFGLYIQDDGTGFAYAGRKEAGTKEKGMGLHIMKYRSRYFGGKLRIKAGKTDGVIVSCTFEDKDEDE